MAKLVADCPLQRKEFKSVCRTANATGLAVFSPFEICESTAPIPSNEVSTARIDGSLKSGWARVTLVTRSCFGSSNAS